jgi:hypothetical protein
MTKAQIVNIIIDPRKTNLGSFGVAMVKSTK